MGRGRTAVALAGMGVLALAGSLLLAAGDQGPQAARSALRPPAPGDPLTGDEIARAGEIASATLRTRMSTGRVELLYVERDDDKAAAHLRRADAYIYDYGTDRLIVRTVDLGRGEVVAESAGRGVRPPPSRTEEARAAELLLADPGHGKRIRAAYAEAAGRPLRSASDLGLRALVYTPRRHGAAAAACRTHRCVRLFARLPDGTWLDTTRIAVDLSAKKIIALEW
ncbi:Tat pathway signal sequence domain protein [Planomonospora venezuelensis]|uniref:Tat pathway signal sequence domain protein n=1 Tax=Planomonospora venezuelensis TaxID=1999 RepID=A0A841D493_PLAVE|nr:Tat pathway signal sequence domain protein [Planomonospora venezuelensis]MBB5962985.1 hypothetical protein [Planomonospora venezuelensis]GIN00553.1 hypothetical protein Pve01_22110 [Planomonospora venezuelensis]